MGRLTDGERREFADLVDKLTPEQREIMAAALRLVLLLQGADPQTQDLILDGVVDMVQGPGGLGLAAWRDAIEGWE